ncbi:trimeric intracellular cation channel type B isoform X2 [Trichechus manatus latirostris]|uniref:Trimeric intracellular cation channel type B isoform X2 n=1 Tax=Trichechus manatus latirostris TaxID=127582 RepID=A0A2Y9QV67_TRIMA|nr:trimeric intracellular cation channel type B isoform X2 [Trichechus manatus latirostris]
MESPWDELTLAFSRTSMFPFFDIAHYLVSLMAMKRQPGAVTVAWKNPFSSWFTAMLHCFGGGILSCILLAEPPVRFLANNTNILLASSIWYIIFFCPCDLVCQAYSFLPVQLLAAGMKEVTRTWKIVGAGGTIITNFEQLIKGTWKPEADEWLKMSYPSKVTLLGSVMFTFQHTKHLAISKHNLMFFYTVFLVATKITMMLTETSTVSFAPFEDALGRMLFGCHQRFSPRVKKNETKSNGTGSSTSKPTADASDKLKKKHSKKTE